MGSSRICTAIHSHRKRATTAAARPTPRVGSVRRDRDFRSVFGHSDAAEPDPLIKQLRDSEAFATNERLVLTGAGMAVGGG
ncbi:hypothetical protein GCM10017608_27220 [Agromyces luteolus]|nr:hypothetical protein GCM10017608_27220 [Agromyces luteolus]